RQKRLHHRMPLLQRSFPLHISVQMKRERGDYFGPVTVASTYVHSDMMNVLKEIGVKDSKAFSDATVFQLSKEILSLNVPYSLLILPNQKYNSLQEKGWSQGKMKAMLHHHVNQNVIRKIEKQPYEGVVIDQFCDPA